MTTRLLMTAALALGSLLPAVAQGPPDHGGPGAPGSSSRLDYLTGYLSLTDSQKASAKAIFDAEDAAVTTAQGQLTAAHDALKAAIKTNKTDAEIDRLAAAVGAIQGQIAGIRAKAAAKFYNLLTSEQKTKYDALGDRGPGRRGGSGFGR